MNDFGIFYAVTKTLAFVKCGVLLAENALRLSRLFNVTSHVYVGVTRIH